MKKSIRILLGLAVVLVGLFVALELWLDRALVKTFNLAAPAALGVPARLDGAHISLLRGHVDLRGLHVGNPEGFHTDGLLALASVVVRLDPSSLAADTLVIREIAVDGLVLTYERGLRDSNLGTLIEQLSGDAPDRKDGERKAEKPDGDGRPAKKVVVDKLAVSGTRMNFSVTGAAALTGGGAIPIPLPPIALSDLGKEEQGISAAEAVQRFLGALAGAAGTAIAGSAQLIGDAFGAVGDGLWAAGKGAASLGGAVAGGTVDAGKAVVGGAGEGSNTLNPVGA